MITKFARLEFELFTKPSKTEFLRVYQVYRFAAYDMAEFIDSRPSDINLSLKGVILYGI